MVKGKFDFGTKIDKIRFRLKMNKNQLLSKMNEIRFLLLFFLIDEI